MTMHKTQPLATLELGFDRAVKEMRYCPESTNLSLPSTYGKGRATLDPVTERSDPEGEPRILTDLGCLREERRLTCNGGAKRAGDGDNVGCSAGRAHRR